MQENNNLNFDELDFSDEVDDDDDDITFMGGDPMQRASDKKKSLMEGLDADELELECTYTYFTV